MRHTGQRVGFGQHGSADRSNDFVAFFQRHAAEGYKGSARGAHRIVDGGEDAVPPGCGRCDCTSSGPPDMGEVWRGSRRGVASGRLAALGSFSQHPLHDGVDTCLVKGFGHEVLCDPKSVIATRVQDVFWQSNRLKRLPNDSSSVQEFLAALSIRGYQLWSPLSVTTIRTAWLVIMFVNSASRSAV